MSEHSILRHLALCAAILAAATAQAQSTSFNEEAAKAGIAFDQWLAEGDTEQINWKVQVLPARLGTDQRLRVILIGTVTGEELNRKSDRHDLHLVMRVRPPGGRWFPSYSMIRKEVPEPLPPRTDLEFSFQLYAAPGTYEFALLLFDAVTGERSMTRRNFVVEPLKNDPLPQAFRTLPGIEFLGPAVSDRIPFSYGEEGRLWLPASPRRPVHVEIVVNLSRSEQYLSPLQNRYFLGSPFFIERRMRSPTPATLLSVLKALTDLKMENGTLHVTALDLSRRRTPFQQNNVAQFDWPRLVEAVKAASEPLISADALSGREQNSTYFREAVQQRLAPGSPTGAELPVAAAPCGAPDSEQQPLRVLILVSEAILFDRGADVRPVKLRVSENCRVFYVRYMPSSLASFDDLDRMMKPLKPQRFDIGTPMDLRRALRKIIDEIGKL